MEKKPLAEDEIVIHVPKGAAKKVHIEESDVAATAEITVRVSKQRKAAKMPVLGVIVK